MNATDHSAHLATLLAKERGNLADFLVSLADFLSKREAMEVVASPRAEAAPEPEPGSRR